MKPDMQWRKEGGEVLLFTKTPKGAAWIAKNLTTNIHDTIHCEPKRGEELLAYMREDGLAVEEDTGEEDEEDEDRIKWRNYYRCPSCNTEWEDDWSCCCNDECPNGCMKDIEPYKSVELDEDREEIEGDTVVWTGETGGN